VQKIGICLMGLALLTMAVSAQADMTNVRPVTEVTFRPDPPVNDLQEVFNSITNSGPGIDVGTDQTPWAVFTNDASGGPSATMIIELADYTGTNEFGLFEFTDPSNKALVFTGGDDAGQRRLISFFANGDVDVDGTVVANNFGSLWGFYLDVYQAGVDVGGDGDPDTLDYTLYTLDSLNDGGMAQALVYRGDDQTTLEITPYMPGIFSDNEFIIAFEDLLIAPGFSDRDYTDMVVLVESITPVPAPAAFVLGLVGLGVVGVWARRHLT